MAMTTVEITTLERVARLVQVFDGPNVNPFRKAVERELPGLVPELDSSFRLETDEEQFRRHMEWFNEIEGIDPLPDDDGEEGRHPLTDSSTHYPRA